MHLATCGGRSSIPLSLSPLTHAPLRPQLPKSRILSLTPNPQKGFFISLAIIPAFLAWYKYVNSADQDGSEPQKAWFTRLIHSYSQMQESWELRNALHAKMVDQAADDRTLFFNSKGSHGIELRFPEYVFLFSSYFGASRLLWLVLLVVEGRNANLSFHLHLSLPLPRYPPPCLNAPLLFLQRTNGMEHHLTYPMTDIPSSPVS